jgi:four helix bundle protein
MNDEELKDRVKKFAFRCIRLAKALSENKLEQYIRMQLVAMATSCAINVRTAFLSGKQSEQSIQLIKALEELDGCCFWIECIITEALKKQEKVNPLLSEALELRNDLYQRVHNSKKKSNAES